MAKALQRIGRLALRREGSWWRAYYAMDGTMDGAIELGSIRMKIVDEHKDRKDAFIALMREGVADIIEEKSGARPTWGGEEAAPESERAGQG